MLKKGMVLYSILKFKCPACHEGDFFVDNNPLHLKNLSKMHKKCPVCKFKYEIEPNFFQGAMYISYGLTVCIAIISFVILFILNISYITTSILILIILILMMPLTFRLARIIYINFFKSYEGEKNEMPSVENEESKKVN